MDANAKDLRTEAVLSDRSIDGNAKYGQGGSVLSCHRNKTYQDIGSSPLAKADGALARPCAVIGPDRVVPPAHTDVFYKKGPPEPWLAPDNTYRRPPEYPHKLLDYQHPSRNISPRQTFQENMQRILVPPTYNAEKSKEDHSFPAESNSTQLRNEKLSVSSDSNSKYCDVPYTVNPLPNEPKNLRNSEMNLSNTNIQGRGIPHGWPPTNSNIPPSKPVHQDMCQYLEYQSCAAPRPVVMTRPHRTVREDPGPVYPDGYYHNGNLRFKPYPMVKERYPQTRYEYYSNPFHPPPPFPTHKYDLQKPMQPHPYPSYQQVPLKYMDSRMADPIMNGYQRSLNQQAAYSSMPFRNQVIHPTYGSVPGNCLPTNKYYPYPTEAVKSMPSNKLSFDSNSKLLPEYDTRSKNYSLSDAFYINEITRPHTTKGPVLPPSYHPNIQGMPSHPYYRKESIKGYEYSPHFRNMDQMLGVNGNIMSRFPSHFPPSAITISPTDSNTSSDTNQTQGIPLDDCGYVSQSSTASARSIDSVINKVSSDVYRRYDQRYSNIFKGSAPFAKYEHGMNSNSKDKKDIDVRQFLQMWNEGEEEGGESSNKEVGNKSTPNNGSNSINAANCGTNNQEQLYVLGLVNVPSEELGKYQHIQKVSKLPENIKGYNSIELLHQFEEVVESSNLNHYHDKTPAAKTFYNTFKSSVPMHAIGIPSRPLSPLDVEAKISQSIIHKEVGCNFEIKPCSPKMLNVEVATPIQNVMGERMIEKVSNPHMSQSPIINIVNESRDDCNGLETQSLLPVHDHTKITSCKMVNKPYGNKDFTDPVKTNYSIQDLESNSGVCLASLPRLDNDIELNFPEVNQQFINANKVESVITPVPVKDLPPLDTYQTDSLNRELESDVDSSLKRNTEKDFSKLSKYRRIKRKNSAPNTPESNVQALRTDSVIIKNPENCKYENMEKSLSPKILRTEAQNNPLNLSVNTENCLKSNTLNFDLNKSVGDKSNEFAIDFSMNSNETCSFTSDLKVPKIIPTDHHNSNCLNVKKDLYKKIFSPTHEYSAISENRSCENEREADACRNDDNVPSLFTKESLLSSQSPQTVGSTLSSAPTFLQEKVKPENESNVASQNTQNCDNVKKCDETDKEALNRKLSTYNLLSSQEKEDTLNEKMRELFGEDFSTVETNPDFEKIHDTQAIFDDNFRERDCVFSDDEDIKNQTATNNNVSDSYGEKVNIKSEATIICQHVITDTSEKMLNEKNKHESETPFTLKKNESLVADKVNENEETRLYDVNSCVKRHEPQKPSVCSIKKELMSPWIQKLIIHDEGSRVVVSGGALGTKSDSMIDTTKSDDIVENNQSEKNLYNPSTCNAVIKTKESIFDQNALKHTYPESTKNSEIGQLGNITDKKNYNINVNQRYEESGSSRVTFSHAANNLKKNKLENNVHKQNDTGTNKEYFEKDSAYKIYNNVNQFENDCCIGVFKTVVPKNSDKLESDLLNNSNNTNNNSKSDTAQVSEKFNDDISNAVKNGDQSSCRVGLKVCHDKEEIENLAQSSSNILKSNITSIGKMSNTGEILKCNQKSEELFEPIVKVTNKQAICNSAEINDPKCDETSENQRKVISSNCSDISNASNKPEIQKSIENHDTLDNYTNDLEKAIIDECEFLENDTILKAGDEKSNKGNLECDGVESCSISKMPVINGICEKVEQYSNSCKDLDMNNGNIYDENYVTNNESLNTAKFDVSLDLLENRITSRNDKDTYTTNSKSEEKLLCSDNGAAVETDNNINDSRSNIEINKEVIDENINNENIIKDDNKELEITKQLVTLDEQFDENCQFDCSPSINKSPELQKNSSLHKKNIENSIKDSSALNQDNCLMDDCEKIVNIDDSSVSFSCSEDHKGALKKQISEENIVFELKSLNSSKVARLNSIIIGQSVAENYKLDETVEKLPDIFCHQTSLPINQSLSTDITESSNSEINVNISKQTILEELSSSSEVSDDSDTSDDENTSDSTDHESDFYNAESTHVEHENKDGKEESTSLPLIKDSNYDQHIHAISSINDQNNKYVEKDTDSFSKEYSINGCHISMGSEIEMISKIANSSDIPNTNDSDADENVINDSDLMLETSHEDTKYEVIEDSYNEVQLNDNCVNIRHSAKNLKKRRKSLKRSLSDSAIDDFRDCTNEESSENNSFLWQKKRKHELESDKYETSQMIAQNICRVLQNNRRNSISSIHNEGNVSFCILIDNNCIISEECDDADKICVSEVPEDYLTCIDDESLHKDSPIGHIISIQDVNCEYSNHIGTNKENNVIDEPWVEDVACVETVVSDDIAENIVISASSSPKDDEGNEEKGIYNFNEHTDKLKNIYGDKMYNDDAHFVETLYRTPQMNVNQTLHNRESQINLDCHQGDDCRYYDKESLERVLSESNVLDTYSDSSIFKCRTPLPSSLFPELPSDQIKNNKSNSCSTYGPDTPLFKSKRQDIDSDSRNEIRDKYQKYSNKLIRENVISCESSIDDAFNCKKDEEGNKSTISSSPEVSSTTSEDKNSCILLKITNYGGSRVSQVKDNNPIQSISCKYTEKKDYSSSNGKLPTRTLLTKAAQKYIPPLKETTRDLKVKLPLPHQSLMKLKQMKFAKETPKIDLDKSTNKYRKDIPKKLKPKFEDVLKSIDEIQFQKHKENFKKGRKSIPKVVIKKNEHGSHYASTSNKHPFNPDLTGRKWQPWVFLEKHNFIDKMALRKKTQAIFSYRKNSYVLAEKFQKYKSVCNPKFIISQPKQDNSTSGQLKYTIRLKHNY